MEKDWEPFQYQLEIAEKAKLRNCIAFLSTGSGKTFISILLIKYVASNISSQLSRKAKGDRKWIAFLAPTIPLVEQQVN